MKVNSRLGSYILAPVLNLLQTGPHGMDGFPQGVTEILVSHANVQDEAILKFLRDRLALVRIKEPGKEYIEQLTQTLPKVRG